MKIQSTIDFFKHLLLTEDKKSQVKLYRCYISTFQSLENKSLSDEQTILIENKLEEYQLKSINSSDRKQFKKIHRKFANFLKEEFSFTKKNHYMNLFMSLGMVFGQSLGMSFGLIFGGSNGLAIGLSTGTGIGMALGMAYGTQKDKEAKEKNLVL